MMIQVETQLAMRLYRASSRSTISQCSGCGTLTDGRIGQVRVCETCAERIAAATKLPVLEIFTRDLPR